ncbi:MAG: caspase family protein [Pseudomonadota bacterium]
MPNHRSIGLSILAGMALWCAPTLAAAQSTGAPVAQAPVTSSPYTGSARQSAVDAEVQAIMQMLRNEGIDIDARMARARSGCRGEVMATAEGKSEAEIQEEIEGCALAREGVVYAQAINEMNANRVNAFNSAMAQHNAQVAEAARKQREYEQKLQGHNAEVAAVQAKQQQFEREQAQYEADLEAHRQELARMGLPVTSTPARSRSVAQSAPPTQTAQAAPPAARVAAPAPAPQTVAAAPAPQRAEPVYTPPVTSQPVQTAPVQTAPVQVAQARPPAPTPQYTAPAATQAPAPQPQTMAPAPQPRVAQNTAPAPQYSAPAPQYTPPQNTAPAPQTRITQNTNPGPGLARGAGGATPRGYGRRLSNREGEFAQQNVQVAIAEASGPRIALVIGNERYSNSMGALSNPVNDAVLIRATLRSLGFDVEIVRDGDQKAMKAAVRRFGDRLAAAGDNATGLFYYAGHGVQSGGQNFLIPVGSDIDSESDLELEAVRADAVLAQMEEAYVSTRIVILDACRNMPLRRRTRDGTRGLAQMSTPNGSFVAYSTSPGSVAIDGGGVNSPYAEALAEQMLVQNRDIELTFREVRKQVVEMTNGDQVPWDASSLLDTFVFALPR